MTSKIRLTADIVDFYNESDESDQEYVPVHSRFPCGDIDIADLYKKLCFDNMVNSNRNRRLKKSVSVQTDHDTSNIPPSWLLAGERLIEELYTGLGNIINTMYHNSRTFSEQDAMRKANINPSAMKYFKSENGYWQSILLPSIRIPIRGETDWQNKALCSEETKRNLRHLLEIAAKLRNVISYLSASCENQQIHDDTLPSCFSGKQSGDLKRSQSPGGDVESCDHDIDLDEFVENGSDSGKSCCSPERCEFGKFSKKRVRKESAQETVRRKFSVLDDSCRPDEIPGIKVLKYTRDVPSQTSTCCFKSKLAQNSQKLRNKDVNVENAKSAFCPGKTIVGTDKVSQVRVLSSCSNVSKLDAKCDHSDKVRYTIGEKRALFDPENCNTNKLHITSRYKNFIRKNIMDIKNKTNRVSTIAVGHNFSCNLEVGGTSQNNRRETVAPSTVDICKKCLR